MQTLLKNAKVFKDGAFVVRDILINNGIIVSFEEPGNVRVDSHMDGLSIYDFNNMVILPGFVDVHVHLREPGFSYKEDIASGTAAAASAGYTDVCPMPNLKPVPDSVENLAIELEAIKEKAVIKVHPYASITKAEQGEAMSEMSAMAKDVIGFSDDGVGVVSDQMMRDAFTESEKAGKIIAAHCEFKSLMGGAHVNAGPAAEVLNIEGISNESEWKMIERDIKIAEEMGAKYHVCHVSTAESIELIRQAKRRGVDITCETGPHYLVLDDQVIVNAVNEYKSQGYSIENLPADLSRFKMNPPFRSPKDRQALLEGLLDGTIDMIATDHAPHSMEEKGKGIIGAPMGVVGLETAFPVMYTKLVKKGVISLERVVELMSLAPAKRFGIEAGLEVGKKANLCVYDLHEEFIVDPEKFVTKGRSTPFKGEKLCGKCKMTICEGKIVYDATR